MNITKEGDLISLMLDGGSMLPLMINRLVHCGWRPFNHHDNWIHPDYQSQYSTHEAYEFIKHKYENTN